MNDIQILREIAYYSKVINQYKTQNWKNNSKINKTLLKPQNSFNKYKYVKKDLTVIQPVQKLPNKVLINPNFKVHVHVNPHFKSQNKEIHVNPKVLNTQMSEEVCKSKILPQINSPTKKRRLSIRSKYKIVKSTCFNNTEKLSNRIPTIKNKYKLDRRSLNTINKSAIKKKVIRHGISDMLRNNVFKNKTWRKSLLINKFKLANTNVTNISGILYKKSKTKLQKIQLPAVNRTKKVAVVKNQKGASNIRTPKSFKKNSKLLNSSRKLRKNNLPCPVYQRYGTCRRKKSGRCYFLHNPNQIFLCRKFLQGACIENNCLLSHKVSLEKMPTCKYFLEGCCVKNDCPYLHVKINPKAEICRKFLQGFCEKGSQCDLRHQFLCPNFERNGKCPKRKCLYPHKSKSEEKYEKKLKLPEKFEIENKEAVTVLEPTRYYTDKTNEEQVKQSTETDNNCVDFFSRRPQLGSLPSFIPFDS